jgi:type II secretory ATPase GspE/PulE/Tfp pilus assembly ATPase PilB-like protein
MFAPFCHEIQRLRSGDEAMGNRIGELLVREKLISLTQLRTAQEESRKGNTSLGYQLARLGFISDKEITNFLSQEYRVPAIDLGAVRARPRARQAGHPRGLRAPQGGAHLARGQLAHRRDERPDEPARHRRHQVPHGATTSSVLLNAIKMGASDIHIEPYEKNPRALPRRRRAAGSDEPPLKLRNAIISRIKIMADLDIAERRLPQDGRIKLKMPARQGDRLPRLDAALTIFGEKIVHASPRQGEPQLDMAKLGFERRPSSDFMKAIASRTAWCSSPAPPARARPRRCTRPLRSSTSPRPTS